MNATAAPARQLTTAQGGRLSRPSPITDTAATTKTTDNPRNTENGLSFSAGNTMLMHVVMTAPPRQEASTTPLERSRPGWTATVIARAGTANTASRTPCALRRRT